MSSIDLFGSDLYFQMMDATNLSEVQKTIKKEIRAKMFDIGNYTQKRADRRLHRLTDDPLYKHYSKNSNFKDYLKSYRKKKQP